jgi:hypothetical protein
MLLAQLWLVLLFLLLQGLWCARVLQRRQQQRQQRLLLLQGLCWR